MRHLTRNILWITIVVAALGENARADYLVNGGFETGNLAGWTTSQGTAINVFQFATSAISHTGTYSAALGNQGGLGLLSQVATGLTVGTSYELTFWFRSDGNTPNRVAVQIGGDLLVAQANLPAFAFREFTFSFTANSTSEILSFGTRNDPGFFELDDVSIAPQSTAVPEPSSLCLMLTGGCAVLGMRRRRGRTSRHGLAVPAA